MAITWGCSLVGKASGTTGICYTVSMGSKISWDIEKLPEVVANSTCWVDVIRAYGLNDKSAGNWKTFQSYANRLGIDTSHFVGKRSGRAVSPNKRSLDEILVADSDYRGCHLRGRLIQSGLKPDRCESCHLGEWMGQKIALELDHINGNNRDNRIENLRILCPNCHAMTDTWRGRNKNGAKADVDEAAD